MSFFDIVKTEDGSDIDYGDIYNYKISCETGGNNYIEIFKDESGEYTKLPNGYQPGICRFER